MVVNVATDVKHAFKIKSHLKPRLYPSVRMDEAWDGDMPNEASFAEFNAPKIAGLSITAMIDEEGIGSPSMDFRRMLFLMADVMRSCVLSCAKATHIRVELTAIDNSDPN